MNFFNTILMFQSIALMKNYHLRIYYLTKTLKKSWILKNRNHLIPILKIRCYMMMKTCQMMNHQRNLMNNCLLMEENSLTNFLNNLIWVGRTEYNTLKVSYFSFEHCFLMSCFLRYYRNSGNSAVQNLRYCTPCYYSLHHFCWHLNLPLRTLCYYYMTVLYSSVDYYNWVYMPC